MNEAVVLMELDRLASWAARTSLAVALPALLLLALGLVRRFPDEWRVFLAAVIGLRLLLPGVPELSLHPAAMFATAEVGGPLSADSFPTAADHVTVSLWSLVWLGGCAGCWLWAGTSHVLLWSRIRRGTRPVGDDLPGLVAWCARRFESLPRFEVRCLNDLSTPAVFGWIRPVLLLPADLRQRYTEDEIRGMLLHELEHVRRRDGLWNWLGILVCALHWFNPLAWLCLRRYRADRELACDRRTLELLSARQRDAYGHALLKTWETVSRRQPALLTSFLRRNSTTYHRIAMSIQSHPRHKLASLLALSLVPVLGFLTLTTARADRERDDTGRGESAERGRDGAKPAEGSREGDARKPGPRDGDGERKPGPRDGEGKRKPGPRDGEGERKPGPRDGEGERKPGPRDGEGERKPGPRDGDSKREGER